MRSQAKIFVLGAVLGVVFGATVLASIGHLLLIGLALVGAGALLYRGRRRMVARAGREERRLNS
jgi:uncharacterized membrane protein YfcA